MMRRPITVIAMFAAVITWVALVAAGQETPADGDGWSSSRTPWGEPDLQGIWSPGYTLTPLERPDDFEGREFLTDEEIAALESGQLASEGRDFRPDAGTVADVEGAYNDAFTGRGTEVIRTRRTSLIVDPPDGKLPPLTDEAKARGVSRRRGGAPQRAVEFAEGEAPTPYGIDAGSSNFTENPEDRPSDRCTGITLPFVSGSSGTYSRIVQSPGALMLYHEDGHRGGAYRTIHVDGRPHVPSHIRQWLGDSVGHWEGDTLVVNTTNFTDKTSYNGSRDNLHLGERFTRVASDMILYEVTLTDPTVWTSSWTIELPLSEGDNRQNQIFEAACHEGNYAMTAILAGARLQEK